MRIIDADRLKKELTTLPVMSNWGESMMPKLIDDQPTVETKGLIDHLKNEITRRDNLLAEMGIRLPPDETTHWEYKTRGGYRQATIDGWVRCPRCKTVFVRFIGEWYKHCPECGKRMGMRGE